METDTKKDQKGLTKDQKGFTKDQKGLTKDQKGLTHTRPLGAVGRSPKLNPPTASTSKRAAAVTTTIPDHQYPGGGDKEKQPPPKRLRSLLLSDAFGEHSAPFGEHLAPFGEHLSPFGEHLAPARDECAADEKENDDRSIPEENFSMKNYQNKTQDSIVNVVNYIVRRRSGKEFYFFRGNSSKNAVII